MGRLDNKVVLITGAASGIGEGTARQVIEQGGKVVIADLQAEKGAALAAELGANATAIKCDVTLEEDIAAAVDHAVAHFGRLDGMVNNAGIVGAVGKVAETDIAAFDFTMSILSRAVFLGMKHAARVMQPQGSGVDCEPGEHRWRYRRAGAARLYNGQARGGWPHKISGKRTGGRPYSR